MRSMVYQIAILALASSLISGIANSFQGSPVDYFDRLRSDPTLILESSPILTNNLQSVVDVNGSKYALADLTTFLPLSDGTRIRSAIETDPVTALLAIHYFNYPHLSPVVADSQECNIKLTTEFIDTAYSPIQSTRLFTDILQRPPLLEKPLPAGVIGAYRSAESLPLAILTGVNSLPQISYASTSTDFDNKDQFPYFGRTVMSSIGEARVALDYFLSLQATHIGVLFVTDSFGSALQKAFQDAASDAGIITNSVAFSFGASVTGSEIPNAVQSLKKTQFRLFYVIAFENHYAPIMESAQKEGLIGDDFLWLIHGYDHTTFHAAAKFQPNSALANATNGLAMLAIIGALRPEIVYPGDVSVSPLAENPTTSYEKFRTAYREAITDPEFDAYVRSKLPSSIQVMEGFNPKFTFDPEPRSWALLLYDAVTSLGIAFCRAQNNSIDGTFTGKDVFNEFKMLNVEGVTGQVKIIADTGTRDYTTLTFTMFNFQRLDNLDENDMVQYKMVPTSVYSDGSWKSVDGRSFTYANGGTRPPQSLPEPQVDSNYIGDKGRIVGYSLMSVVMLCSVFAISWTVIYQREPVVNSSQPLFLVMVAFGSLVMSSTIVPLSLEEPISVNGLDIACMVAPWLYIIGYLLAFSALFAKTRRMNQIFRNADLEIITVTKLDIFGAFLFFFLINAAVLVTWTLVAPLEWVRGFTDSTDLFDRLVESYGRCASNDTAAFVSVLLAVNFTILAVSNWWAYRARNIETEYDESRFIGISMASVLQAWSMGIPILIVVDHNPQAKFFVATGIIFVTAMALLSLIFVPKMYAIKKDRLRAEEERKLAAFKSFRGRVGPDFLRHEVAGPHDDSVYFDDVDNDGVKPVGIITLETALSRTAEENVKPGMVVDELSMVTNGLADADEVDASVAVGLAGYSECVESSDEGSSCPRLSSRSISAPNVTETDFEQPSREKQQSTSLRTVFKSGSLVHTLQLSMSNLIPSSPTSTAVASAGIRVLHNPLFGKKIEDYCCSELEREHTQEANNQRQCEKEAIETTFAAMNDQGDLNGERARE